MFHKRIVTFAIATLLMVSAVAIIPTLANTQALEMTAAQNLSAATVYDDVSPSVVAINVYTPAMQTTVFGFGNPNQIPQNQQRQNRLQMSSGSGFVIDQDGHIVTNAHVVENATRIEVNFFDGTMVEAEIVGLDTDSDLAVIKVNLPASKLYPVTLANSDSLDIGQEVLAIGSPFGQRWTLTEGIVSALDRTISGLTQFSIGGVIQTDAAINPGNSGGPLLNMQGEVIGVNSQILSESGSSAGIGYAIPSNLVQYVANELIANGSIRYSYLGIQGMDINLALIQTLDLPNDFKGVAVMDVVSDSPADVATLQIADDITEIDGLQVPQQVDIITAINGIPIENMADLVEYIATKTKPSDRITLDVLRNGQDEIQLTTTLVARPIQQ